MEITPAQKVTSDNFKAHLSTLQKELALVNSQLEEKLSLKEISSKELDELSDKKIEIGKYITEAEKRLDEIKLREEAIPLTEAKLEKSKQEFEKYKAEQIGILTALHDDGTKKLNKINLEIKEGETLYFDILSKKDAVTLVFNSLTNDVNSLADVKNESLNDIAKLAWEREDAEIAFQKEISARENELKDWEAKLEKAKADVATPLAALNEAKKKFASDVNDFEILRNRVLVLK